MIFLGCHGNHIFGLFSWVFHINNNIRLFKIFFWKDELTRANYIILKTYSKYLLLKYLMRLYINKMEWYGYIHKVQEMNHPRPGKTILVQQDSFLLLAVLCPEVPTCNIKRQYSCLFLKAKILVFGWFFNCSNKAECFCIPRTLIKTRNVSIHKCPIFPALVTKSKIFGWRVATANLNALPLMDNHTNLRVWSWVGVLTIFCNSEKKWVFWNILSISP